MLSLSLRVPDRFLESQGSAGLGLPSIHLQSRIVRLDQSGKSVLLHLSLALRSPAERSTLLPQMEGCRLLDSASVQTLAAVLLAGLDWTPWFCSAVGMIEYP